MDCSLENDAQILHRIRKEEQRKEDVKVFKETMNTFGIEQQEVDRIKSSLETSGTVRQGYPIITGPRPEKEIGYADIFLHILLLFKKRPGSEKWWQTLNHLRKWTTLPAGVVTELVDLVKNDKKWISAESTNWKIHQVPKRDGC